MFGQVVSGQVVASIEIPSAFRTRICGGGLFLRRHAVLT